MKKYRLKKDLPDLKAGEVFSNVGFSGTHAGYFSQTSHGGVGRNRVYVREYVENNPEWFEEVKEKEWEVTAFRFTKNSAYPGSFNRLQPSGKFEGGYTFERMWGGGMMNGTREIYSVKRLADNVEFTLKDKVVFGNSDAYKIADLIDGFALLGPNEKMIVKFRESNNRYLDEISHFDHVIKPKWTDEEMLQFAKYYQDWFIGQPLGADRLAAWVKTKHINDKTGK